jgi:LPS-assembly lipoprotein
MRIVRRLHLAGLLCAALLLLTACGFQLRGSATLPFDTIYLEIPEGNVIGAELKRNLRAGTNVKVVDTKAEAQAILTNVTELRTKIILSINSAGRVREFRLRYNFNYSLNDKNGKEMAAPAQLSLERDYSFSDNQVLAKEAEETLLYRDMQNDLVQQIIRRLAATSRPAS